VRRRLYEIQAASPAPIVVEALARIGVLHAIETDIRGCAAEERHRVRQSRSKSALGAFTPWFEAQLAAVSGKSTIAEAIRYALTRWDGLDWVEVDA
jgi:transposase